MMLTNKKFESLKHYISDEFEGFLAQKSKNTAKNYRGDLNQFFNFMFEKDAKFVTIEELATVTGSDVVSYRNKLESKQVEKGKKGSKVTAKQKGTTANRKITAIRTFFKYLEADFPEVRSAIFNKVEKVDTHDKRGWGELMLNEVNEMVEKVKKYDDGKELSVLFEVAFITAIRLDALLTATYNENIYHINEDGNDIWVIDVIDKDKRHVKSISDELKAKLDSLGHFGNVNIFKNLHEHKVGDAIRDLVKEMNLDPRRNIRFHSFKKASVNYVLDITGDIKQAQLHANHSSATTTLESYIRRSRKLTSQPSYYMDKGVDTTPLHELSHEDLLKLIEKSSIGIKAELIRNIDKL
jgi:integrase